MSIFKKYNFPVLICMSQCACRVKVFAYLLVSLFHKVYFTKLVKCISILYYNRVFHDRFHHHMRLRHPKEVFKCKKPVCCDYFPTKVAALEHFKTAHASKKHAIFLACDLCQFQTVRATSLEMHIIARHFPRTLKCPECPKMFASKEHIHEHSRKTHNKSRRKCPHCGMTPALYNTHVVNTKCFKCFQPFKCFTLKMRHKTVCKLTFKCDFCDKEFRMESLLLIHFNAVHRKNDENTWLGARKHRNSAFTCKVCKIYFPNEGYYNNHFLNIHKADNKLTCHLCEKLVRSRKYMEYHLVRVHGILKKWPPPRSRR
jgi:Zinc-finger of C2H2 type